MAKDPRAEANAYLRAHGIKELFADLGARLMFERPKDPNAFLLEELERVQDDRKCAVLHGHRHPGVLRGARSARYGHDHRKAVRPRVEVVRYRESEGAARGRARRRREGRLHGAHVAGAGADAADGVYAGQRVSASYGAPPGARPVRARCPRREGAQASKKLFAASVLHAR